MRIDLPDIAATARLAEDIAAVLRRGDLVALSGGLGAGKTSLARAIVRAFFDDSSIEVPSPTFTLVQTYSGARAAIAHFDLYRLASGDDLDEIAFDEARDEGIVLVEWPERAGSRLPVERLDVALAIEGAGRVATIGGAGPILERFRRSRGIREFLDRAGRRNALRRHLQGDASSRAYERIGGDQGPAVLMDWPSRDPEGALAKYRASDVRAFLAVDMALREAGFSAPAIEAADVGKGLLLMEDLGSEGIVAEGAPIPERYRAAAELLATMHARPRSSSLPLPDGTGHTLPTLDREALALELSLFPDWYIPHATGRAATGEERRSFEEVWSPLLARLDKAERSWVLLDYHSPNLLWLPERAGAARVGLLDFQDAMIGPTAYDLASLAEDARVTVPADLERRLLDRYVSLRKDLDPAFDDRAFREAYLVLAAQRATRILGVFARLATRDRKPAYLAHIPRLREYLSRIMAEPVFSGLAVWYEMHRLP